MEITGTSSMLCDRSKFTWGTALSTDRALQGIYPQCRHK